MYWPDQELSYEMENLEPVTCGVPANVMAQLPLIIWGEDESTKGSVLQCQMCAICQQDFKHGHVVRTLPCFDSFHMDCVDQWLVLSKRCPICRTGVC
ncbi:hypothetical protein Pelo_9539 [Pelomyxa schiedti]|nr:hypothetical protein Pelo_9539 [Pelomyxa schiedti]